MSDISMNKEMYRRLGDYRFESNYHNWALVSINMFCCSRLADLLGDP